MSWEYKCETIKCPASEIEDKMNEIGKEGWEIFCLYEKDYKSEIGTNYSNGFEKINWYELAMKRSLSKNNIMKWSIGEWNKNVSNAISLVWKTDKPNFDVKFYDKDSCLLTLGYLI